MNYQDFHNEVNYRTSRSGGAGGQHVNKVATKVELLFHISESSILNERMKAVVLEKLANRISSEGILSLKCDDTRSQLTNKEIVFDRFINLIRTTLIPLKKRRPTKPSKSSIKKRLDNKKKHSEKKSNRKFKDE